MVDEPPLGVALSVAVAGSSGVRAPLAGWFCFVVFESLLATRNAAYRAVSRPLSTGIGEHTIAAFRGPRHFTGNELMSNWSEADDRLR